MSGRHLISAIPEVHLIVPHSSSNASSVFSCRADKNGKEFVSIANDVPRLEWRITKSHVDTVSVASQISRWVFTESLNTTIVLGVPDSCASLLQSGQIDFLDSVCSSFVVPKEGKSVCASAWTISGDFVDDLLARGPGLNMSVTTEDFVPVVVSVALDSLVEYQKFLRRVSIAADVVLFLRFALFSSSGTVHMVHFIVSRLNRSLLESLSPIPAARTLEKTKSRVKDPAASLTTRCMRALLARDSRPFVILWLSEITHLTGTQTVFYQCLFDMCERLCLVALLCGREGLAKVDDFKIVSRMDLLVRRSHVSAPQVEPDVCVPAVAPDDISETALEADLSRLERQLDDGPDDTFDVYENEISELKAKNLILRTEIDRLKISGGEGAPNAYTSHLVAEVKSLRGQLLQFEQDKRKYLTSKRLVDSLVEKTNKLKSELAQKNKNRTDFDAVNANLRSELDQLRTDCEKLLAENASLRRVPTESTSHQFRALYTEFLFPFKDAKQVEKCLVRMFEIMRKFEVSENQKRGIETLDKLRLMVNSLIAASQKLEMSAACMLNVGAK